MASKQFFGFPGLLIMKSFILIKNTKIITRVTKPDTSEQFTAILSKGEG